MNDPVKNTGVSPAALDAPGPSARVIYTAFLLALAAVVFFVNLADTTPTENKEIRVWKVSAEMFRSGDWLVPRIDGSPHLTKPPLYYWCAVASARLAGDMSLFALRAPSVLAALGLLLLALAWARTAAGNASSLLAALLLFSMARFPYWARMATFELSLSFFCLLALYLFFKVSTYARYRLFPLVCLFSTLAFLTKGTAVAIIVLLPCVVWLLILKNAALLKHPATYLWLALFAALALSWYAVLVVRVPAARAVFYSQLLLPLGAETEMATATHYQPFYYYLLRIWEITFPVCLFIPLCARRAWLSRLWRDNPACRFLFVVFSTLFLAFSALPGKQMHYLLPVFLPLAVLVAESIRWGFVSGDVFTIRAVKAFAVFWAILLAISVVPVAFLSVILLPGRSLAAAALPVAILAAAFALFFAARRARWAALALAFLIATALLYGFVLGEFLVWDTQFKTGAVASRPDYDAARWDANFKRFPFLRKVFALEHRHNVDPPKNNFTSDPTTE